MSDLEDDETPQLSAHALAALQEFYAEQKQQIEPGEDDKYNIGIIEENWQLSQFWYSQETALRLAQEAIAAVGEGGRIACVSAPSVYQKLRELCRENFSIYIFEYDKRFAMYGEEFIFYDYNNPLDLPERIAAHSFDIVIADPPYLSEECLRKTSETIKYLTRGKILLCTVTSEISLNLEVEFISEFNDMSKESGKHLAHWEIKGEPLICCCLPASASKKLGVMMKKDGSHHQDPTSQAMVPSLRAQSFHEAIKD
ncbi:EEF1A lysine methyltransferase 1 isoform X2 [Pongo pygmaeus]|uniref:EEF1A lysine methyltransferase 1 isoform X2 n=1 Tax=Pongo abelii TaxID=9601 RepID=UPI0023E85F07|nr:EEF1A lysine methyltransferase 1 isoform X2 [Pongo abelii]XP_054384761.1 EEF1A lysine methyltransferase 1 isoform X2 [Pongo abelii]XP_054384762.1 EEF1A lysine methyltransferase 1 isoform X2 [Pongo abelii]XP_054384763.1 EEF1A lysine methyltransferase 1 isoform X2 [Pongo abelii]